MSPFSRLSAAALVPVATLAFAGVASAAAPNQSAPTESGAAAVNTRVCVVKKTKRARVVRVTEHCQRREARMTWHKYQQFASNSAASGSGDVAVGVPGPQGLTGAQGAQGPQGATGAQGAQGVAGPQGAKGDKGDPGENGAQGPAGPSDIYVSASSSTSAVAAGIFGDKATLTLPAGQYLLMGQARVISPVAIGFYSVECRLRQSATDVATAIQSDQVQDADADSNPDVQEDNLFLSAPLVLGGPTVVTLRCQGGILPAPAAVTGAQLTAIKTGALHT